MTINPKFKIGSIVYLKTDIEQRQRIVQFYHVFESDITYQLGCGLDSSEHHWFEISSEQDQMMALGIDGTAAMN